MERLSKSKRSAEPNNVDRWLVSYADYMTLLFALFVILYAMAIVNEDPFETVTESIGRVFQSSEEQTKNKGQGPDILPVNTIKSAKQLYGDGILEVDGPELLDGKKQLSNIQESNIGTNLDSLEEQLHTALYDLVESGYAELEIDGDWLEIQLNSALLFPSGSATAIKGTESLLTLVNDVVGSASNYIRVRGYTDNLEINNEVFTSNWELSVFRATAILRVLESLGLESERMAIEGYGQYSPNTDNSTEEGRAQNRRVVIAISKYGIDRANIIKTPTISIENINNIKQKVNTLDKPKPIRVIELENGGLRITTDDTQ